MLADHGGHLVLTDQEFGLGRGEQIQLDSAQDARDRVLVGSGDPRDPADEPVIGGNAGDWICGWIYDCRW